MEKRQKLPIVEKNRKLSLEERREMKKDFVEENRGRNCKSLGKTRELKIGADRLRQL
jgi:hypothetical protein